MFTTPCGFLKLFCARRYCLNCGDLVINTGALILCLHSMAFKLPGMLHAFMKLNSFNQHFAEVFKTATNYFAAGENNIASALFYDRRHVQLLLCRDTAAIANKQC